MLAFADAYLSATPKRSNAGILVDTLQCARSNSSIDLLASLPREWFHFAHMCDAAKEVPAESRRTARCHALPRSRSLSALNTAELAGVNAARRLCPTDSGRLFFATNAKVVEALLAV